MKNRFLLLGDAFWGTEVTAPDLFADMMIAQYPERPWEFIIESHERRTLDQWFKVCPRDIIGKKAGITFLSVGWTDLSGSESAEIVLEKYQRLIQEIQHNSQTKLVLITIPTIQLAEKPILSQKTQVLNQWIAQQTEVLHVVFFQQIAEEFIHLQNQHEESQHGLFSETGTLNPLGAMKLALELCRIADI